MVQRIDILVTNMYINMYIYTHYIHIFVAKIIYMYIEYIYIYIMGVALNHSFDFRMFHYKPSSELGGTP